MVNEQMPRKVYDITGGTEPLSSGYDIPFSVGKEEELHVYTSDASGDTLVDSSEYELSSDTEGEVATHITFASDYTFPENASKLTLIREVAIKQEIDLKEGEKISANILEEGLDNAVRICLMLQEQIKRAILMSRSDEGSQVIIPNAEDRAGHLLAFDENGQFIPVLQSDIKAYMETAVSSAQSAQQYASSAASSMASISEMKTSIEQSEANAKASEDAAELAADRAEAVAALPLILDEYGRICFKVETN